MDFMINEVTFNEFCEMIRQFESCMDDYLYVYDIKGDMYFISNRATERFMLEKNLFQDVMNTHRKFVYPEDNEMLTEDLQKLVNGEKEEHDICYRWLGKDNKPIWINCRGRVIKDEDNNPVFLIGCVNEIGATQIADNISGLLASAAVQPALSASYREGTAGYVLRLGLDDFKDINEKFGSDYGDYVLRGVAEGIVSCLLPGQQVYREQSDEYLILDFTYGSKEDAMDLYERIRIAIDGFIEQHHYEAVYTISGGAVYCDELNYPEYDKLMKFSQFALSEAKKRGKNQIYNFNDDDYQNFLRKRKILRELRASVATSFQGFDLHYQPIVLAEEQQVYATEALLRFTMPDGEPISPMEMIPILEDSGLIIPVGKWVLQKSIEMCKICQRTNPDFRVSVNLSYMQVLKTSITSVIRQMIQESGLKPHSLMVEMTESGYLENTPSVKKVWNHLKEYGIYIALDDFGTGYSNFQSIGNMMPHVVKLDRGFTLKALNDEYENKLMAHIINMVHGLGLKTCVEGIETQEEYEEICKLSPDFIQGYYFGKPCSKDEFLEKFLAQ